MAFKPGDEVILESNGRVGSVVRQRLNEDFYVVRFERYCDGSKLKLMSEVEAERKASKPLDWWAPELTEEYKRLTPLLKQDLEDGKLSAETIESMTNLGLITNL
jgi:hypothetical protein